MAKDQEPRFIPVYEEEVTLGLLSQYAVYQRVEELNAQIARAKEEMLPLLHEVNQYLSNDLLRAAAKGYAKKRRIRMADRFEIGMNGSIFLVCEKRREAVGKAPKKQGVPTLIELRERGKGLGIDVDALGLGRQRRLIAAHLDGVQALRPHGNKMSRKGDSVPVTVG